MKKRGGPRPGAGRPVGSKNSVPRPRGPARSLVALSTELANQAHDAATEQGLTLREWMDRAVRARLHFEADFFSESEKSDVLPVLIF